MRLPSMLREREGGYRDRKKDRRVEGDTSHGTGVFKKGRWLTVPRTGERKLPQTEKYTLDFRHGGHYQLSES